MMGVNRTRNPKSESRNPKMEHTKCRAKWRNTSDEGPAEHRPEDGIEKLEPGSSQTLFLLVPFSHNALVGACMYVCMYMYIHTHTYIHTLHYITLHYITLHYITLHYITLHYITLHYITLHYITLHYITLHYITLHYITYIHTYIHTHTQTCEIGFQGLFCTCAGSFLGHNIAEYEPRP